MLNRILMSSALYCYELIAIVLQKYYILMNGCLSKLI